MYISLGVNLQPRICCVGLGSKLYSSNMPRQGLISYNRLLASHAQQRSYSILEYAKRKDLLAAVAGRYGSNGKHPPPPPI